MVCIASEVTTFGVQPIAYIPDDGLHIEMRCEDHFIETDNNFSLWFVFENVTQVAPENEAIQVAAAEKWIKEHGLFCLRGGPRRIRLH